jgi:hypothetical protein
MYTGKALHRSDQFVEAFSADDFCTKPKTFFDLRPAQRTGKPRKKSKPQTLRAMYFKDKSYVLKKHEWNCVRKAAEIIFRNMPGMNTFNKLREVPLKYWKDIDDIWLMVQTSLNLMPREQYSAIYAFKLWEYYISTVIRTLDRSKSMDLIKIYNAELFKFSMGGSTYKDWPTHLGPCPLNWMLHPVEDWQFETVTEFTHMRGLPNPSGVRLGELKEESTRIHLMGEGQLDPEFRNQLSKAAICCAREFENCGAGVSKGTSHCSVSGSGSYESPKKWGGRCGFMIREAISWLKAPVTRREITTPFGCVKFESIYNYEAFESEEAIGLQFGDIFHDFPIVERVCGLNPKTLGAAMYVWSCVHLIEEGYMDEDYNQIKPIPNRSSMISENGNKGRRVTVTLSALITFLQPFSHIGKEYIESDPTLQAGLNESYNGYRYADRLSDQFYSKYANLLQADFKEATAFIDWLVARLVVPIALRGMPSVYKKYIRICVFLLTSPRLMDGEIESTRGIFMGEPGSKVILTIIGKILNILVNNHQSYKFIGRFFPRTHQQLREDSFSTAGDDIIAIGMKWLLELYITYTEKLRMMPSILKWGIHTIGVHYCQQFLRLIRDPKRRFGWKTHKIKLIDLVKHTLLSPFTKRGIGMDADSNPIWGRSKNLAKELSWVELTSASPWKARVAKNLFIFNMKISGCLSHLSYHLALPSWLGGIGVFKPNLKVYDLMPKWHKIALNIVYHRYGNFELIQHALKEFSDAVLKERGQAAISQNDVLSLYEQEIERLYESSVKTHTECLAIEKPSTIPLYKGYMYQTDTLINRHYVPLRHIVRSIIGSKRWCDVMANGQYGTLSNTGQPRRPINERARRCRRNILKYMDLMDLKEIPEITNCDFLDLCSKEWFHFTEVKYMLPGVVLIDCPRYSWSDLLTYTPRMEVHVNQNDSSERLVDQLRAEALS